MSYASGPQNTIVWKPKEGLILYDSNGHATGVQSAALGLVHEIAHALNRENVVSQNDIPNSQYENDSEAEAVIYSDAVAKDVGETLRGNYEGTDIITDNPTAHTGTDANGQTAWIQVDQNDNIQRGPGYVADAVAPSSNDYLNDPSAPPPPFYSDDGNGTDGGGSGGGGASEDGSESDGGGTEDGAGCVAVTSFLPGGMKAGDVVLGTEMQLADEQTLEPATGKVTYSQPKLKDGYRITTETGASLVYSDTAPIPTYKHGLVVPPKLLGEEVPVRWDEAGQSFPRWEKITKVEFLGKIMVQHITVGDRCFWAGEKEGAYILHHNAKNSGGDSTGGDDWPDEYDPLTAGTGNSHVTAGGQHAIVAGATVQHAAVTQNAPSQHHTAIAAAIAIVTGQQSGPAIADLVLFTKNDPQAATLSSVPADQVLVNHDATTIVGVPHPVVDHFIT